MAVTASKHHRKRVEVALAKAGVSSWKGDTVHAYVNHDRWVADCACNGAELVTPGHKMLCGSCGAESEVVFPDAPAEIEALLEKRPTLNRNWKPGETVDDLQAQNIEHGIFPDDMRSR